MQFIGRFRGNDRGMRRVDGAQPSPAEREGNIAAGTGADEEPAEQERSEHQWGTLTQFAKEIKAIEESGCTDAEFRSQTREALGRCTSGMEATGDEAIEPGVSHTPPHHPHEAGEAYGITRAGATGDRRSPMDRFLDGVKKKYTQVRR